MKNILLLSLLIFYSLNLIGQCPTNVDFDYLNGNATQNGTILLNGTPTDLPKNLGTGGSSCICNNGTSTGSNCFEVEILNIPNTVSSLTIDLDASNGYYVDPTEVGNCTAPINTNQMVGIINFTAGTVPSILICKTSGGNLTLQRLRIEENTAALPVELVSFEAKAIDVKSNQLDWQTASEFNNLGFEIERSDDGLNWDFVDFVKGQGTTNQSQSYSFTDRESFLGLNYYRLKQIDIDGKFEYSKILTVFMEAPTKAILQVFPNPNHGNFTFNLLKPFNSDASIRVFGTEGNLIYQKYIKSSEELGQLKHEFNLPPGKLYYVVAYVGDEVLSQKIIARSKK